MIKINLRFFGFGLATMTMLSACGETQNQLTVARSLTCTELAREIGKREQRRDSARVEGVFNSIISVVADDEETREGASIDSAINTVDEIDAERSFEQLNEIYSSKGCV